MKDIFANLYNKVVKFFHQAEVDNEENAKDVACNRLKLVLMQDRTNLTPAIMDRMRHELIELLSKYLELDQELLDLNFEHEDNQMALMLSIPVLRAKSEEEIQAILDKEDELKAQMAADEEEEESEETETDENAEENSEEDSEEVSENEENADSDEDENLETEESESDDVGEDEGESESESEENSGDTESEEEKPKKKVKK